jgi:hypothetical protein
LTPSARSSSENSISRAARPGGRSWLVAIGRS